MIKKCNHCKQDKDFDCFHKSSSSKDGLTNICKECISIKGKKNHLKNRDRNNKRHLENYYKNRDKHRNIYLKKRYNITLEIFYQMIQNQENRCAGCGKLFQEDYYALSPVVDHDHETGEVRGILHWSCNTILGSVKEDINVLDGLALYLKKHKNKDNA